MKPSDEAGWRQSLLAKSITAPGCWYKELRGSSAAFPMAKERPHCTQAQQNPATDGFQLQSNSLKKSVDSHVGVDWGDDVLELAFDEMEDEWEDGDGHEEVQATSRAVDGKRGAKVTGDGVGAFWQSSEDDGGTKARFRKPKQAKEGSRIRSLACPQVRKMVWDLHHGEHWRQAMQISWSGG
ncbi:hypothetical protein NDU88_008199 [Pleurodeles waltl]|uniref:Uncharacterized protein n=1 Tax=Pleurodeles waltl TaxID=8319 RepID=A0AAV7PRG3_PLEWA|nr:hypothetical protein NDU88_008199 [Pleurodeles waltl]